MFVKICGITRTEDAEAAVALGATALGFVFWRESPRFIDWAAAQAIVAALPPEVASVGVFVNQDSGEVNDVAAQVKLGMVQLHGDETVEYAAAMTRPVVKAFPVSCDTRPVEADAWPASVTLLLDVHDPERRGGTGRTVDWATAAAVAASRRVLLAGGLSPGNVVQAITQVRPFGIDVSSGIEQAPGLKNHDRLRALFEEIRTVADLDRPGERRDGGSTRVNTR